MPEQDEIQLLAELLAGKKNPYLMGGEAPVIAQRQPAADFPNTSPGKYVEGGQRGAIEGLKISAQEMADRAEALRQEEAGIRSEAAKNIQAAQKPQVYIPDVERQKALQDSYKELSDVKTPERDVLTQAILSLGSPVLAALTGGNAALAAAAPASEKAEQTMQHLEKNQLLKAKMSKEQIAAKIKTLQDEENKARLQFKDQRDYSAKITDVASKWAQVAAQSVGKDKEFAQKKADDLLSEISKMEFKSPTDVAKAENDAKKTAKVGTGGKPKPVPGQVRLDQKFAEEYEKWVTSGGYATVEKNLQSLDEVLANLDKNIGTGGPKGLLSPRLRGAIGDTKAADMQEKVESVIQDSLRQILGAQYTEKEGKDAISRAYNPTLPPKENAARVRKELERIRKMGIEKQNASKYFEENGMTLQGYKASPNIKTPEKRKPPVDSTRDQKIKYLESLGYK